MFYNETHFFSCIPLCSVALLEVEVTVQGTSSPQIEDKIPWSIGIPPYMI